MKASEITAGLEMIERLSRNPIFEGTAKQHFQILINTIKNDELETAKRELNAPVCGKSQKPETPETAIDSEFIHSVINNVLEIEFDNYINEKNSMEAYNTFNAMRKRITTKVLDKITGHTTATVPIIQAHAVRNFWYANHYFSHKDKQKIVTLLFDDQVYNDLFEGFECDFLKFLEILSEDQQAKLITYIMENYNGISLESVEFSLNKI